MKVRFAGKLILQSVRAITCPLTRERGDHFRMRSPSNFHMQLSVNTVPARDASRSDLRGTGTAHFASKLNLKTMKAFTHPHIRERVNYIRIRSPSNGMPKRAPEAFADSTDVNRKAVIEADLAHRSL